MSCPHGANSTPTSCSQCIGATPRIVTQTDDVIHVDGEPVRSIQFESPMQTEYRKRRAKGRR